MKKNLLFLSIIIIVFSACSVKPLDPISFEKVQRDISYSKDIKPILDKRCVSCHSCYNSPCQLKLSSFEGFERGSSKIEIYANRLSAIDPTRLFIDATTEEEWREKGFDSVLDKDENGASISMYVLNQKNNYPKNIGSYAPETDELTCSKNSEELAEYFEENPHKGMPYGLPALKKDEYNLLQTWLDSGAINDTILPKNTKIEDELIEKFEAFLNDENMKNQVSARYIFEHLFLAHISFDDSSENFFELVRSRTPSGVEVDTIATRYPFSKVDEKFYYRFKKFESTLVHKTHMVYKLNDKKLDRYKELFIEPKWNTVPYMPPYKHSIASNALKTFQQIPTNSRYLFLLDDIHYIIMTFIRGPVCKGQVALNVIQDHFWVMFKDPKYDLGLIDNFFLIENSKNLFIPNEEGNNPGVIETLSTLRDYDKFKKYFDDKSLKYDRFFPDGLPVESIWKGNKNKENDSILTIYRHFDSASVHKGALGNIPKTLWVMDYALVERLYYSLVAGFDIFGNIGHQLLVRKYMDGLRIEGEYNFLRYLPSESRERYFNEWYIDWDVEYSEIYDKLKQESYYNFTSDDPKKEFVNMVLDYTNNKRDSINFIEDDYIPKPIKKEYKTIEEIEESLKALSITGGSKVISTLVGEDTNIGYLKIKMENGKSYSYTVIVNKWLDNVAYLFNEEKRRKSSKDDTDYIKGLIGSYPNIFIEVDQKDLGDFFDLLKNYKDDVKYNKLIWKFAINRSDPKFWDSFDWFDGEFKRQYGLYYGLFDINRYFHLSLEEDIKEE